MRNLVLPLLILALAGCESLVAAFARPDVTTARVEVEGGEFSLDPTQLPTTRLIEAPTETLLLEAMRRIDEG